VEVVVDVDLAVAAAADQDKPVDLDDIVVGELLEGVPVASGGVRIGVDRDVEIDRRVVRSCHGSTLLLGGDRHATGCTGP
jgi:hypothetical protein